MSEPAPAAAGQWQLSRRQALFALLAGSLGYWLARGWVVPKWTARVETGGVDVAQALDAATSEVAGIALASAGLVLMACHFHVMFRNERLRRATRAQRELDYLASLGESRKPFTPTDDDRHP